MNDQAIRRDRVLTTLAVLIGIMAISNLWKPMAQAMSPTSSAGFVFFGTRLHGVANAVIGPLFGCSSQHTPTASGPCIGGWCRSRWRMPLTCR
jgi:hypothetical protein